MKHIHLKNQDNPSSSISSIYCKPAFLFLFVFVTRKFTLTESLRSIDYPGNETDHIALLAIKSQLVDHPGGVLRSWNDSVHHCNWEGVTCGRKHSRVTVLDLHSRGLSGTISPFIANLTFLETISLNDNSLYGQIPRNLGDLFRLQALKLSKNALVGGIPANLSSCINLRVLSMSNNKLEGEFLVELRALSKLEYLDIESNNLTGPLFDIIQNLTSLGSIYTGFNTFTGTVPNSIGRMQNLTNLALSQNQLSGTLPVSLFNISTLQTLDVTNNLLHGELPPYMGVTLPRLTWLNLAGNSFSGSIPDISNVTSLELILLHLNRFTGKVPHGFQRFHNLHHLSLSSNNLEGDISFLSTLVNCTKLISLQLSDNGFSGILPKSVANLSTTLKILTIGDSLISGALPAGITNLVNLQNLYMVDSQLTGSIPHDIGKLHKLESLALFSNRLTGVIPSSLGNLSLLGILFLDDNKLEERIPPSIGNCQSLLYLNLSTNVLNGTIDNELFMGAATFVEVYMSHNHLEGPLPEIGKQTNLQELSLSKNKFSGLLPNSLSECTELHYLYMNGNFFHGDIPSSYVSLASLQEIDFSENNLSGPFPAFFAGIPSIYHLDLSQNDFQGRVPTNSVFANASAVFLVGNNRLCGGIPELHLPKCNEKENMGRKRKTMSHALKLIIPIICALVASLAVITGLYLTCLRKKKTPLAFDSEMGNALMRVSYDMLLKATDGFSSQNLLGSGSFGSVFKGKLDGNTVAVKVLDFEHHASSKSFMAECKALRNVRHRNLVGFITACSSIDFQRNEFRAIVYEFMPNGSLDKWLHGGFGNMSLPQRVSVAIDVAHAFTYLHNECETPIVHNDLKPSNILLDHDMVAHVGDFGLAKFLAQPPHPNQSSTMGIRGTVGYAAPEYGLGSEVSTEGDIYSYGILLLELMTGKSPTDNMFKEDYNLHMYGEEALPDRVLQIVDPALEEENHRQEADDKTAIQDDVQQREQCIISVISVGVSCSNHLPYTRMKLTDAISRLQSARDNLLDAKSRLNLPARGIS